MIKRWCRRLWKVSSRDVLRSYSSAIIHDSFFLWVFFKLHDQIRTRGRLLLRWLLLGVLEAIVLVLEFDMDLCYDSSVIW